VINSMQDIQSGVDALGGYGSQLYVEQWVQFKKELAVMVARYNTIKHSILFTESPLFLDQLMVLCYLILLLRQFTKTVFVLSPRHQLM